MIWGRVRAAGKRWGLIAAVAALLLMPLISASWWLVENDRFAANGEIAITEIRVRDVGTRSTPLVGLIGRLGRTEGTVTRGCHPGPLSFYALAPAYRLIGPSFFALRASTLLFHALAILLALWIAHRRAGAAGVVAAGVGLSAIELGLGFVVLTEPWNPYLPPLWFVVFLLCVWSVACEDSRLLPLAAGAGCLCAQTHVAYLAVCGLLGLFAFALTGAWLWRARRQGRSAREHARACVLAASLTAVLWIPPLVDQSIHEPGNLAILADFFLNSPEPSVGFQPAFRLLLTELDVWHATVNQFREPSTFRSWMHALQPEPIRGGLLAVLWLAALAATMKVHNRTLWALHATVAASVLVAWLAMSRILGVAWPYLLLWGWSIGLLMSMAIVASAALLVQNRLDEKWRGRVARLAVVGVALTGIFCVRLSGETAQIASNAPNASLQTRALAEQTAAKLAERKSAGQADSYLLAWSDVLSGVQGFGLLDELDRRGFAVRVGFENSTILPKRCLSDDSGAAARLFLASGDWIGDLQAMPGAVEIAYADPRTPQEQKEFANLYGDVVAVLRERRREDLIAGLSRNLLGVHGQAQDPWLGFMLGRMIDLGHPAAVFVLPIKKR
jgi:hypothetical protein